MGERVKRRTYNATRRQEQARRTRRAILLAAVDLFTANGYAATSVVAVAARAGVAVDTVYAAVGRKPQLLLAAHDLLLGELATDESGEPVPALQRRYVQDVQAAAGAARKLRLYADALRRLFPRTVPLWEALREAGATDQECRSVWESLEQRRAANMRLFAADLRATGELRPDLDDDDVADLIWSMGPGYFAALQRRGWSPERFAELLAEVWTRVLLDSAPGLGDPASR